LRNNCYPEPVLRVETIVQEEPMKGCTIVRWDRTIVQVYDAYDGSYK
jgi:hypothetical protein